MLSNSCRLAKSSVVDLVSCAVSSVVVSMEGAGVDKIKKITSN